VLFLAKNAPESVFACFLLYFTFSDSFHLLFTRSFVIIELTSSVVQLASAKDESRMLTVKKFAAVLDLALGGYAAGVVGLVFAYLAIDIFPPDFDLQGKLKRKIPTRDEIYDFSRSSF
jgi:hypothetical protein